MKPAKLTLTPHHLYYLLSRFEVLGVNIGNMNVRLEDLNDAGSPSNYVSFLKQPQKSGGRSDRDSIHSVSSVRSVMSSMSSFWSNLGLGSTNQAKTEKAQAQLQADLKYLYSAFTKIPSLRLSPDRRARLIQGYEVFPFESAVPLVAFKNVSVLEICDLDFRTFYGWDRLADQLRSLTIKRGHLDDPTDLIIHVVLDDMDRRRRRSSKVPSPSAPIWPPSPTQRQMELARTASAPGSPLVSESAIASSGSPRNSAYLRGDVEIVPHRRERRTRESRDKSASPSRGGGRPGSSYRPIRTGGEKMKRDNSGSSHSSTHSLHSRSRSRSSSNLLSLGVLPATKWRFLRHLCLADNGMTSLSVTGLSPLSNTLQSLDLSSNLFAEVPDCLAILTSLRSLDLSNCMINSLHSLARNPLPAISVLNLRGNRLASIAGVERMLSLERFDIRDNRLADPTEIARLTGIPDIREIWVDGNPFVRSHGSYRVTIFNLFRGTPGRPGDIIIDCGGPGYTERRQLREWAQETSTPALARPPSVDFDLLSPVAVKKSFVGDGLPSYSEQQAHEHRPTPHHTQSEYPASNNRRKRVAKRRIVDLSAEETPSLSPSPSKRENGAPRPIIKTAEVSPPQLQAAESLTSSLTSQPANFKPPGEDPFVSKPLELTAASSPPAVAPGVAVRTSVDSSRSGTASADFVQTNGNSNGDGYRQKVQALKNEFGTGWLRMLSETKSEAPVEDRPPKIALGPAAPIPADLASMRASSQTIVSGARTLG